jgi:hypothetical protein
MAEHVTIKVFKRHGMKLGFNRGDQENHSQSRDQQEEKKELHEEGEVDQRRQVYQ